MGRGRLPCLVLTSGGVDSAACLSYYLHRRHSVRALFVDYLQPARVMEAKAASAICRTFDVRLESSQVTGPRIQTGAIHGRNGLLLHLALMAVTFDAGLVCLGVHAGTRYPDCSPLFLERVQALYDLYSAGRVRIDAPFVNWSKRDVYDFAVQQGVPVHLTYSCLAGTEPPCGVCESCRDVESLCVG